MLYNLLSSIKSMWKQTAVITRESSQDQIEMRRGLPRWRICNTPPEAKGIQLPTQRYCILGDITSNVWQSEIVLFSTTSLSDHLSDILVLFSATLQKLFTLYGPHHTGLGVLKKTNNLPCHRCEFIKFGIKSGTLFFLLRLLVESFTFFRPMSQWLSS